MIQDSRRNLPSHTCGLPSAVHKCPVHCGECSGLDSELSARAFLSQEAHVNGNAAEHSDQNSMALGSKEKHVLIGKIEEYNRRIQLPTFHIKGNFTSDDDLEYEGALRFFLAHAENNFTKAIRLTSSTTWKQLKPSLLEKFNLTEGASSGKLVPILYAIRENGESAVRDEDCPLALALDSFAHIQFVLRVYQEGDDPSTPTDHKQKNNHTLSFFAAMKKKLNKTKSNPKQKPDQNHAVKSSTLQDPVISTINYKKASRGETNHSSVNSCESRKKSDTSKGSAKQFGTLKTSAAVNAKSMDNLAKSSGKNKHKSKVSSSMANMLAIDDTEEFITIHGDRMELGVDEVVIPIDGSMSVHDIIADVLEECDISLGRVDDFVLCDVIGRDTEGIWLTDYSREMNDNEKPLLLISMVKPSEGLSRRFELKLVQKDDDCASHGNSTENTNFELRNFKRAPSQSLSNGSNPPPDYHSQTLKFPSDLPYFLTIQSYDAQNDAILYLIDKSTSIMGSSEDGDRCNLRLSSPDVLAQHGWICKVYDHQDEYKCVSLAPFPGAVLRINDEDIHCKTNLKPGDVISVGKHYVFLFKDPTKSKSQNSQTDNIMRAASSEREPSLTDDRPWREVNSGMSLQFSPDKQDALISKVISIMSPLEEGFKLTPAYLFALILDHARISMRSEEVSALLIKICNEMNTAVWDGTKSLQTHAQGAESVNPIDCIHIIWPNLQTVIFWMANCIELRSYINDPVNKIHSLIVDSTAMSEACGMLSDAITYAFQQAVYHLTKVLYPTLDTILVDNPFSRIATEAASMSDTLHALSMILELCNTMALNVDITAQLFTYLFFFIGTSLCNKLFENESATLYYNWEEGVKIRKNLEFLENWALDQHMEGAVSYLSKVISVSDFLATSKQFLIQASWLQLRNLYPKLSAPQLRHLLENYDLGNRPVPPQWSPPSDEIYAIMDGGVLESFEDHPPLALPTQCFIDISLRIDDKTFHQSLDYMNSVFGNAQQSEDETDSGFDIGHSRSPTEVEETRKLFEEHPKAGSRSSNNSNASKPYTPIFKKKKNTPPARKHQVSNSSSVTDDSTVRNFGDKSAIGDIRHKSENVVSDENGVGHFGSLTLS